MAKMNSRMRRLLNALPPKQGEPSPGLLSLIESGFVEEEGCYFIKNLKVGAASLSDFDDRTGYECFINSIHVSDFSCGDLLGQALLFVNNIFASWDGEKGIRAIIIMSEPEVVVKLHIIREGEEWLDSDLEDYNEAIMFIDSNAPPLPAGKA